MRGDSIPSRVLIASQPQEGNEASLDFRAEGLPSFISLSSVARMRTSYEAREHHTSRLIVCSILIGTLPRYKECGRWLASIRIARMNHPYYSY